MEVSRNITSMPPEVIDHVLSFLEPEEQLAFGESCTYINDCVVQHAPRYARREIEKTKEALDNTTNNLDFPALFKKMRNMDRTMKNTLKEVHLLIATKTFTPDDMMNTQKVVNGYDAFSKAFTGRMAIANAAIHNMVQRVRV